MNLKTKLVLFVAAIFVSGYMLSKFRRMRSDQVAQKSSNLSFEGSVKRRTEAPADATFRVDAKHPGRSESLTVVEAIETKACLLVTHVCLFEHGYGSFLDSLDSFSNLEKLHITVPVESNEWTSKLKSLGKLQRLILYEAKFSNLEIQEILSTPQLKELVVTHAADCHFLLALAQSQTLKSISINANFISPECEEEFRELRPDLSLLIVEYGAIEH